VEHRSIGTSGLVVSAVGLGCGAFGRRSDEGATKLVSADRATETIRAALESGVTLFDTSDSYGDCEQLLGKCLQGRRDDVVIATKFGNHLRGTSRVPLDARASRRYIMTAVERSLRRLNTDRIDLYQLHSPDPLTPIEETLSALDDLVHVGKVRYIGSSKLTAWQIVEAQWTARMGGYERFVSAQNQYSLLARGIEDDIVPVCERYGLGIIPLRPLGHGLLTGKYRRDRPHPDVERPTKQLASASYDVLEAIERFAMERGVGILDVAIGGLLATPAVSSVIAGATSPDQVAANVKAAGWTPSAEDRVMLDRLTAAGPWPQDPAGSWPDVGGKWIGRARPTS
jgi:aryl-alcohol dehydrogenase-like predicted oxidoreductase